MDASFDGTGVRIKFPFAGMRLGVSHGVVKRPIRPGQPTG